jgi:hypothetical protein
MNHCIPYLGTLLAISALAQMPGLASAGEPAKGPLRLHPANPRYFTDGTTVAEGSLRAIYLTGSHHWDVFQDSGKRGGPVTNRIDYERYLERLASWRHNFIRMWSWEGGVNDSYYEPAPWLRISQGGGKAKFDLERFTQPKKGAGFSVELPAGTYRFDWFNAANGASADEGSITSSGDPQSFKAPFDEEAVLFLKRR